jgi:hypothetical protein
MANVHPRSYRPQRRTEHQFYEGWYANLPTVAELTRRTPQHFYERLETFESYLSSASTGDQLALRNFLGFSKAHLHLPAELRPDNQLSDALMTALSPKNRSSLIGLLLSYRILDVAAVQRGLPSLGLKHRHNVSFGEALQVSAELLSNETFL